MTFEEFLVNPYHQNEGWIGLGVTLGLIAVVIGMTISLTTNSKKLERALILGSVAVFIGVIGTGGWLSELSYAIDDKNSTIAENNLKQKYDIESVLWDESRSDFDDSTGSKYRNIVIQDKDNNILEFRYKINAETREPHLLNDEENNPVKSNDLLLNKSK